ncbi:MAG: histidine kinase [Bacteroidota bacterium]
MAQKEVGLKRQVQKDAAELLDRAAKLRDKNPTAAIQLIEQAIRQAKDRKDDALSARAYLLLADINEDIEQYELAIGRRQDALSIFQRQRQSTPIAQQYYEVGRLYNLVPNTTEAVSYFKLCLKSAISEDLRLKCEEGIADANRTNKELSKSLETYNRLEDSYQLRNDNTNLSRIQAKKANVYAQQRNAPLAVENYRNASQSNSPSLDPVTYKELEATKEAVISTDPEKEIQYRQEHLDLQNNLQVETDQIIGEQLKIADAYLEKGQVSDAEKYVQQSKDLIDTKVTPQQISKVFLKSAEVNQQKGDIAAAMADLQTYKSNLFQGNQKEKKEIDQLLAVLKAQRNIDLFEKDYKFQVAQSKYMTDQLFTQRIIIGLLSLLLLGALTSIYFIYKSDRGKRQANQMLLLKSLRTQMNPHFIFNVLNSVNSFIAKNDERSANKYLSDFSTLMRRVLDDSKQEFISLEKEIELIELYLRLEHTRFRDKFDYTIDLPDAMDMSNIQLPPMLIQPFLENAIWHGIRYKDSKGHILLRLTEEAGKLRVLIEDDGIGRRRSLALKTNNQRQYKSTALSNIGQRLALIRELYSKEYTLDTSDLYPDQQDTGTRVQFTIPTT